MARRFLGALIIIQALAPLIVLVVFAGASYLTVRRIANAAGEYRQVITAQVDTAKAAFARANEGFSALGTYVTRVNRAVDGIAEPIRKAVSSISFQIPKVGLLEFPRIGPIEIPGVKEFKRVVADVEAAGDAVGNQIGKVTSLVTVPAQLREISSATGTFAREVQSATVRWIVLVLGALSFGVAVWFLGSIARIVVEVRRGWDLLRGVAPAH